MDTAQQFIDRFGPVDGPRWFAEGRSFDDAADLLHLQLEDEIRRLEAALAARGDDITEDITIG